MANANKKTNGGVRYMHTVNGRPAQFNGEQIIYGALKVRTVPTLAQIRREQRASLHFRRMHDYSLRNYDLDHVRVAMS